MQLSTSLSVVLSASGINTPEALSYSSSAFTTSEAPAIHAIESSGLILKPTSSLSGIRMYRPENGGPGLDSTKISKLSNHISLKYRIKPSLAKVIIRAAYQQAKSKKVDPYVVIGIIAAESSFNPQAKHVSSKATGLMQIMPNLHTKLIQQHGGYWALQIPEHNISMGTAILRMFYNIEKQDYSRALHRYSGGHKGYPKKVLGLADEFKKAARSQL